MKKILIAILCLILIIACVGCGNSKETQDLGNKEMQGLSSKADFKSIEDTETGTILSLGDEKDKFDESLGDATLEDEYDDEETYSYLNGHIGVTFEYGQAIFITLMEDTNRIKFKDMSFDMSVSSIEKDFEFNDAWYSDNKYYYRYYNNTGKDTTEANAAYEAEVSVRPDGTIRRLSVGRGWRWSVKPPSPLHPSADIPLNS